MSESESFQSLLLILIIVDRGVDLDLDLTSCFLEVIRPGLLDRHEDLSHGREANAQVFQFGGEPVEIRHLDLRLPHSCEREKKSISLGGLNNWWRIKVQENLYFV